MSKRFHATSPSPRNSYTRAVGDRYNHGPDRVNNNFTFRSGSPHNAYVPAYFTHSALALAASYSLPRQPYTLALAAFGIQWSRHTRSHAPKPCPTAPHALRRTLHHTSHNTPHPQSVHAADHSTTHSTRTLDHTLGHTSATLSTPCWLTRSAVTRPSPLGRQFSTLVLEDDAGVLGHRLLLWADTARGAL